LLCAQPPRQPRARCATHVELAFSGAPCLFSFREPATRRDKAASHLRDFAKWLLFRDRRTRQNTSAACGRRQIMKPKHQVRGVGSALGELDEAFEDDALFLGELNCQLVAVD
jgi:hypothetical protein